MTKTLKKTNTLFHTLSQFTFLEKIIRDKGFKSSYADEVISGMHVKILMTSFSNVALFESETQINYGRYSIGLSLDWGKINGLQPVIYTYKDSNMGATFFENYFVAEKDHTILTVLEQRGQQNLGLIMDLKQIADNSMQMLLYLKPDIVKNKKGEEFKAYNDREWRFVCSDKKYPSILFERNFFNGSLTKEYEAAKNYPKPYTNEPVLLFDLDDIKYIVVDTNSEKKRIYDALTQSFNEDTVMDRVVNGTLVVISRESMWDNI